MGFAGEPPGLGFGVLLRQLRAESRLTQEELAAAAALSPRSVSDLERGVNRTARKETALRLAGALGLGGVEREVFVAAARGRGRPEEVLAARRGAPATTSAVSVVRALPRDIACFSGRDAEVNRLLALAGARVADRSAGICVVDGMAGVGKTAFAVHTAHRLAVDFPDGQFFVPLHAHTPGQRPADPADALASLLLAAGAAAAQIPPGLEARAALWRTRTAGRKVLLLVDDAAGHEQIRPLLPGSGPSLVLVTSRRRLAALEDSAVMSLGTLSADEAADLLVQLADLADVAEAGPVRQIAALCGYLPLAIGMFGAQLRHHPARSVSGLAAELSGTRDLLAMMHAENVSVAAAFDLSYRDLAARQQRLFRSLGVVPGPDIDAYAAAALNRISLTAARRELDELYDHNLITEPAPGRYVLHDLLREHARTLAARAPSTSRAALGRLLDYYLHTARAAARQMPAWTVIGSEQPQPVRHAPKFAPELPALRPAALWMRAERANLHAAAEYAAARGLTMHAIQIPAAMGDFLRNDGDWERAAGLLRTGLAAAGRAGDLAGQALALRHLGTLSVLAGEFPVAATSLTEAAELYGQVGDPAGQALALNYLGWMLQLTGEYPAAAASHEQALAIARGAGDEQAEALTLAVLGNSQRDIGDYLRADASLTRALDLSRARDYQLGEAIALVNLGAVREQTGDLLAAAVCYRRALDLLRDLGERSMAALALRYVGKIHMLTGDYTAAATILRRALKLHRDLGSISAEAETLCYLGDLAVRNSDSSRARRHYARAVAIARQTHMPIEEALALEGTGNTYLNDGKPAQASSYLGQALAIYQRIGVPDAERVRQTLLCRGLVAPADPTGPAATTT